MNDTKIEASDRLSKIVASPLQPTRAQLAQLAQQVAHVASSKRIAWEACDRCNGTNCPSGFIPNWKRQGFKRREEALNGRDEIAKSSPKIATVATDERGHDLQCSSGIGKKCDCWKDPKIAKTVKLKKK